MCTNQNEDLLFEYNQILSKEYLIIAEEEHNKCPCACIDINFYLNWREKIKLSKSYVCGYLHENPPQHFCNVRLFVCVYNIHDEEVKRVALQENTLNEMQKAIKEITDIYQYNGVICKK